MSSIKKLRTNSKIEALSKKDRENADPAWDTQHEVLKTQAEAISRLRQQINRQSSADCAIQHDIQTKIQFLKQQAVQLSKSLQLQKHKNHDLQSIIQHITLTLYHYQKIQTSQIQNLTYQSILNLEKKQKKIEYILQQLIHKNNQINNRNKNKKYFINVLRIQRVIDSGIFYNLEKDIINLENLYSLFMIEKIICQSEYNRYITQYKSIKININKQTQQPFPKKPTTLKQSTNHQQFLKDVPQIQHAVKFTQITQLGKVKLYNQSKFGHVGVLVGEKQMRKQEREIKVRKVFVETGVSDVGNLVDYMENMDDINNRLFEEANHTADAIIDLKHKIAKLNKKKAKKTIKYYQREPSLTKSQTKLKQAQHIQTQITKTQSITSTTLNSLQHILKSDELTQLLKITQSTNQHQQVLYLSSLFSELELKLTPFFPLVKKNITNMEEQLKKYKQSDTREQTLDDIINRIDPITQYEKIMKKEDFQKQYKQIRKSDGLKNNGIIKKTASSRKLR